MKLLILTLTMVLGTQLATAGELIPVDKAAHFGISFTVNTVAYAGCKAAFGDDHKTACLVGSVLVTSAIGVAKEVADGNKNTATEHKLDLLADGLGIAASALTIKLAF